MQTKYPAAGCKKGYFIDTASTQVPRGRIVLFYGCSDGTTPDRTVSAMRVVVADSIDELRQLHPEAFTEEV